MDYQSLLRRARKTGNFLVRGVGRNEASQTASADGEARRKARRQIEGLLGRETGDAPQCLCAHKEGTMKLAPFVKFREEKFGAVLFETRSEKVFTLSPTGAAVVREIVSGSDEKSLPGRLKSKYEDKTGRLEKEAVAFLADLKAKGLVVGP